MNVNSAIKAVMDIDKYNAELAAEGRFHRA
jgi:hypothetical protein